MRPGRVRSPKRAGPIAHTRGQGPRFPEPGVFLVRPDGTLYYAAVQTMPFARPHFDERIGALDFAIANNHPARGKYVGLV